MQKVSNNGSATGRARNKIVFVGNLGYNVVEQDLMNIFQQVGAVKQIRILTDKETGKPKGYGFIEYFDFDTAESAVRNLNGQPSNGRPLRVDYSVDETTVEIPGQGQHVRPPPQQMQNPSKPPVFAQNPAQMVPQQTQMQMQAPAVLPPNEEAVAALLAQSTPNQLYDLLTQLKTLTHSNYELARSILVGNPMICYALFQCLTLMQVVGAGTMQSVLQSSISQQQMQPQQYMPPQQPQTQMPPQMDQQQAALMQIMQLSDVQIAALPQDQRQQVLALRAHLQQQQQQN